MFPRSTPAPSLLRGATGRRLGRRDALRLGGLSALGAALAACGVPGRGTPAAVVDADALATFWQGKAKNGRLDFANWPLYMDPKHPELTRFTAETGIKVNYQEVIQEMGPWFAKVQPQLSAKQSIGYDLMVITNGIQFGQFRAAGFLAPLDHSRLPNFTANAGPKYATETFDPGNVFSVPWASGITGIAYDPKKTGREITSLADLWDPKFKGKVGMMSDSTELANFGLLAAGVKPGESNEADWRKAAAKLKQQRDAGIVRKYYEQDYVDALGKGEVWLTQAWSGDVFQKNLSDGTNLKFVIPQEGGTIWTDNFAIPVTAANPVDALMMINFFYRVENAASLAEYINYACPVPAAQAQILKDAAKLSGTDRSDMELVAKSDLVFPSETDYAKLHYYVNFGTAEEQQRFSSIFEPIVLG
ncbi:ABC transporter substrate-binding protein [Actinoplanes sp. SE50]|uniref:polyamine ABC transporter substrate-binding protein n=1 Tax=unclassified Actinoplanes TaxID=2626549 RepID=UPI00023EC096|nr:MULTISPECIES: spermidine/putrescine ABC transporter substrate-binding protein [unclassified Actinoplanes]AEV83514.1 Spermidine/putrescine-binding periplasmic protein [Actinoplanes sp. SE50/110]ATO82342.1 ABC transporter substrate-binding protein [Actinoplanes sp. SE50]SLL99749.1 ABC transporter substrate-binding protein [Actinoplanes sp. SE50/110]